MLQVGRWIKCTHCGGIYAGEHYCGAPWQTATIGDGLDDISPSWIQPPQSQPSAPSDPRLARLRVAVEQRRALATDEDDFDIGYQDACDEVLALIDAEAGEPEPPVSCTTTTAHTVHSEPRQCWQCGTWVPLFQNS